MSNKIQVKGISDKLYFQLGSDGWQADRDAFLEYVAANASFLSGAKIILGLRDHTLKSTDLFELKDKLSDYAILLTDVETDDASTQEAARLLGIHVNSVQNPQSTGSPKVGSSQTAGFTAVFIQKPVRSGQILQYNSHVTIIGDIHPGACVSAEGSILVWGKIKGEVHAGIRGDQNAFIAAFELTPMKLSIAGVGLENDKRKKDKYPEIALIVGNSIKIDSWKTK